MKRKTFAAVTSQQVAQLAGVSQSAVSRTFTPGASISPATREKVLKAAREPGLSPECDRPFAQHGSFAHYRCRHFLL